MKNLFALAALLATVFAAPAQATDVALPANGEWQLFSVDDQISNAHDTRWFDDSNGSVLSFTFTVGAGMVGNLTVVDGSFAGDIFAITNFGTALGTTSTVATGTYEAAVDTGYDFDAALANPSFSRGVFTLGEGSYRIGGHLLQSVTFGGEALNATVGAVQLTVSAVPEPSTFAMLLAGFGGMGLLARRRTR